MKLQTIAARAALLIACAAPLGALAQEAAEDPVLFFVERPVGALLVDYYNTPGHGPFSVIAQGPQLVEAIKACFDAELAD